MRVNSAAHVRIGWLAGRFVSAATVVWFAATFTFLVQCLMPGDRAQIIINMASDTKSYNSHGKWRT